MLQPIFCQRYIASNIEFIFNLNLKLSRKMIKICPVLALLRIYRSNVVPYMSNSGQIFIISRVWFVFVVLQAISC